MDVQKAQKNLAELQAKQNQLAAEMNEIQLKVDEKRRALGWQVLDNPTAAEKTQEELTKLETRAAHLQAANDEMRARIRRAETDLQAAKVEKAVDRVREATMQIEQDAKKALAQLTDAQRSFEKCAMLQSELADLHRTYPADMPSATDLIGVGFSELAANIANGINNLAPVVRRLN